MDDIEAWIKYGIRDISEWLDYLQLRAERLTEEPSPRFAQADVVFGITSALNRMAHIHYADPSHLRTIDRIIPWLEYASRMPDMVGAALWLGIRNPIIHSGTWAPTHGLYFGKKNDSVPIFADLHNKRPAGLPIAESPRADTFGNGWPNEWLQPVGVVSGLGWFLSYEPVTEYQLLYNLDLHEGEGSMQVFFFVDELVQLARHALSVTETDLRNAPPDRVERLSGLNARISFPITQNEWDAEIAAVQSRRKERGLPPLGE